jgi:hypothetical protein
VRPGRTAAAGCMDMDPRRAFTYGGMGGLGAKSTRFGVWSSFLRPARRRRRHGVPRGPVGRFGRGQSREMPGQPAGLSDKVAGQVARVACCRGRRGDGHVTWQLSGLMPILARFTRTRWIIYLDMDQGGPSITAPLFHLGIYRGTSNDVDRQRRMARVDSCMQLVRSVLLGRARKLTRLAKTCKPS